MFEQGWGGVRGGGEMDKLSIQGSICNNISIRHITFKFIRCVDLHTGLLDVFTSFVWFKRAFIRDDLPTLVLPRNATYRYKKSQS